MRRIARFFMVFGGVLFLNLCLDFVIYQSVVWFLLGFGASHYFKCPRRPLEQVRQVELPWARNGSPRHRGCAGKSSRAFAAISYRHRRILRTNRRSRHESRCRHSCADTVGASASRTRIRLSAVAPSKPKYFGVRLRETAWWSMTAFQILCFCSAVKHIGRGWILAQSVYRQVRRFTERNRKAKYRTRWWEIPLGRNLNGEKWSGRMDLKHRPPGPEPECRKI